MLTLLISLLFLALLTNSNLVSLFGLTRLYEGMGIQTQTQLPNGKTTPTYLIPSQNYQFLNKFQSLTDFCDYKCQNSYNLPCFMVLGCNTQLKRIWYVILLPLFALLLTIIFCIKGWWKLKCWGHYLMIFTGVSFCIWVYKKIAEGGEIEETRSNEKRMDPAKGEMGQGDRGQIGSISDQAP